MKDGFKKSLQDAEKNFIPPVVPEQWQKIHASLSEKQSHAPGYTVLWVRWAAVIVFLVVVGFAIRMFLPATEDKIALKAPTPNAERSIEREESAEKIQGITMETAPHPAVEAPATKEPTRSDYSLGSDKAVRQKSLPPPGPAAASGIAEEGEISSLSVPAPAAEVVRAKEQYKSGTEGVHPGEANDVSVRKASVAKSAKYSGTFDGEAFSGHVVVTDFHWKLSGQPLNNPEKQYRFAIKDNTLEYSGPEGSIQLTLQSRGANSSEYSSGNVSITVRRDEKAIEIIKTDHNKDGAVTHRWFLNLQGD